MEGLYSDSVVADRYGNLLLCFEKKKTALKDSWISI